MRSASFRQTEEMAPQESRLVALAFWFAVDNTYLATNLLFETNEIGLRKKFGMYKIQIVSNFRESILLWILQVRPQICKCFHSRV